MPDELLTESPEDKALLESIRTESAPPAEPAPEPPPEAPAAPSAPVAAEPPKPAEQRMVPQQALHEARQEARELKARLAKLETPPEPEIDETQDPIGAIAAIKRENAQFKAWQAAQAEEAELGRQIGSRINSYAKENPDYPAQYQFLQTSRINELRALGHNDQSIAQQIRLEEMQLGRTALQNDLDPGDVIAKLATARGWQKATAPTPLAPAAAPAAPVPAPAPAPAPDTKAADERIARLERGQRAAGTSSGSGGRATAANDLSIEDIVNLDGAAFDSATAAFFKREKAAGNWS